MINNVSSIFSFLRYSHLSFDSKRQQQAAKLAKQLRQQQCLIGKVEIGNLYFARLSQNYLFNEISYLPAVSMKKKRSIFAEFLIT